MTSSDPTTARMRRQQLRDRVRREREIQEQEARERAAKRARWKRAGRLAGAGAAVGLFLIVAAFVLDRNYSSELSGRLQGVQEVAFVQGTQANGGISPVCGCAHPPLDAWRGVTFAGREVQLDRRGGSSWTHWIISGAEPGPIDLIGGFKLLRVEALRFRASSRFDPRRLLSSDRHQGIDVIERIHLRAYSLGLVTRDELRLGLFGSVPVGAWVPFPGAHVRLTARRSQFFSGIQQPQIVESYPGHLGFKVGKKKDVPVEPQVYPVGDFLGPDLVLWTDDSQARIPSSPFARPPAPGVVTALIVRRSTFSTRIGATPIGPPQVADLARNGTRLESRTAVYDGDLGPGKVVLTVTKPLKRRPYGKMRQRVEADPWTWVDTVQNVKLVGAGAFNRGPYPRRVPEQERYPPLPQYAGLNVFGPLRKAEFRGVSGELQIADESVPLGGSADVELGDVKGFRNGDNAQLVSAPLATSDEAAGLEFRAVGTASVNGVEQSTVSSHYDGPLAALGLVVTVIAGALTIFTRLRGRRSDPDSPTQSG